RGGNAQLDALTTTSPDLFMSVDVSGGFGGGGGEAGFPSPLDGINGFGGAGGRGGDAINSTPGIRTDGYVSITSNVQGGRGGSTISPLFGGNGGDARSLNISESTSTADNSGAFINSTTTGGIGGILMTSQSYSTGGKGGDAISSSTAIAHG